MQTSSIWLTQGFFENVAQFLNLKDVGCKPRHLALFERVEGWVYSFMAASYVLLPRVRLDLSWWPEGPLVSAGP